MNKVLQDLKNWVLDTMSEFVSIASQDRILTRLTELKNHKGLVLLLGRSGSGKSVLLERFAKQNDALRLVDVFESQKDFEEGLKPHLQKNLILLDEVGMYEENFLERVRICSDERLFVLSSHKKPKIFKKEHFKSRLVAEFELLPLSYEELSAYIQTKHLLNFEKKDLRWIRKICRHNLRTVDKLLASFKELSPFCHKGWRHILHLCALENHLLG